MINDHKTVLHFLRGMGPLLEVKDIISRNLVTITADKTVSQAAEKMAEHKVSCVVVMNKKKAIGILTERDMLYKVVVFGRDPNKLKVSKIMSSPVLTIPSNTTVLAAGRMMSKRHIRRFLVTEKKTIQGIVTQTDVAHVIGSLGIWRDVMDVMTKMVWTIPYDKTAEEAAKLMRAHRVSSLLITKKKKPIGVLTEKDFLKKIVTHRKKPAEVKVQDIMSSPVLSVQPDLSIFNACRLMEKHRIRRLPIMEKNKLLGIITRQNIFKAFNEKVQMFEDEYFESLNRVPYGFFITDSKMKVDFVNEPFLDIFNIKKIEKVLGKQLLPSHFWTHPKERRGFLKSLNKKHALKCANIKLKSNSKEIIYTDIYCIGLKDVWGKTTGYQGIVVSRTASKKAEDAIRESEEKWRSLAQNVPDYITILDRDGKILFINRVAQGFNIENVIGSSVYDYNLPKYSNIVKKKVKEVFETGKVVSLEVEGVGPKNTTLWYEDHLGPIIQGGKVVNAILIIHDITGRKKDEQELKKRSKELEELNARFNIKDAFRMLIDIRRLTVNRELRMAEIQKENEQIKKKLKIG